mgnify:CR=1 FL=1
MLTPLVSISLAGAGRALMARIVNLDDEMTDEQAEKARRRAEAEERIARHQRAIRRYSDAKSHAKCHAYIERDD